MAHRGNTDIRQVFAIGFVVLTVVLLAFAPAAQHRKQQDRPNALGIAMEGYEYPYPVQYMPLEAEGQQMRMAYMDVKPAKANGKTVLLLHGKNFFGAYWENTIKTLADAGYRVVVPDQIGFGKSTKADVYYTFHWLAANTRQLLDTLGINKASVVGHSMGGMLATRFALMYPDVTEKLILENPIGLEDYKLKVPYQSMQQVYNNELNKTEEGIRKYQQTYFTEWKPEYEKYVQVHYRWTLSAEYPRLAWANALTYMMVYTQPVVYEFPQVKAPALLVIGQEDRTTLGRGSVSKEVLATLGQYPELGRATARAIPDAKLVEIPGIDHIPHLAAPEKFHTALLDFLKGK